ncbi:MAG: hypothetical protein QM754_03060 [Tepidisphaeraceae bacterium]
MTDERTDAPDFDLPPLTTGEDALQVGPADVPADASVANAEAFAMRTSAPKPAAPAAKPNKPISAAANAGVIAALMGKPLPKVAKKPAVKAAAVAAVGAMTPPSPKLPPEPAAVPSTLDVAAPMATESVIDFETSADADSPVGATPASPVIAESAKIADAAEIADTGDAGVAPTEKVAEPFVAFELTQTALPASLAVTDAVVAGGAVEAAEPLAVAFESVKVPAEPEPVAADVPNVEVTPSVATTVAVVDAETVDAAEVAASPAIEVTPPAAIAPKLTERVVEVVPPVAAVDAKPSRRPAAPVAVESPKRPIPVAPVWPTENSEPVTPTPKAQSPRPKAPPAARPKPQPKPAEPELPVGRTGAWWTIPLTFVGIAIVACAVIIPAAEETRRDAYELAKIEQDVDYFQKQSAVNADFLDRVNTDATLAERLAMRQLHQTRPGVKLAPLGGEKDAFGASPFAITKLDPPQPLPPYQPNKGPLTEWFVGDKRPQQMAALGLLIAGIGVMVGGGRRPALSHSHPA